MTLSEVQWHAVEQLQARCLGLERKVAELTREVEDLRGVLSEADRLAGEAVDRLNHELDMAQMATDRFVCGTIPQSDPVPRGTDR